MTEATPLSGWKKLAIRSLFVGAGIAVTLSIVAAVGLWYTSRPRPPKPWNKQAILARDVPGFWETSWVSNDGKTTVPTLVLQYTLENTTNTDYTIDSRSGIKFMFRLSDGTVGADMFSGTIDANEGNQNDILLPLFIPAKQKAIFSCHFTDVNLPLKGSAESDDEYHERIRTYLEKTYTISGFLLFDDANRYQIELPKWASKRPGK
jgi:hypothetical protein